MTPGVVYGCLLPHPPVLVPAVGGSRGEKVRRTREAVQTISREISHLLPDVLVVVSPHAPVNPGSVSIVASDYVGGFDDFGIDSVRLSWKLDLDLLHALQEESCALGVSLPRCGPLDSPFELDHGSAVPLYFLREAGVHCDMVLLAPSLLGADKHYRFGQLIALAAKRTGKYVVLVASGDMSHRLTPGAPAGYDARGKQFDHLMVSALQRGDRGAILGVDERLRDAAGECGYRSLVTALGAIENAASEVLSYEGPFGVGYLVARMYPSPPGPKQGTAACTAEQARMRSEEMEALRLAKAAVESYVREGRKPPLPSSSEGLLARRAGVFVCLKLDGQLRGCVGTYQPAECCVAAEIVRNAIFAAVGDPRFSCVSASDLPRLRYSIDILTDPEPVEDSSQLDPARFGIIVRAGERRSLLLPDLPGVETVQDQIEIARRKAEIPAGSRIEVSRFTVHRIEEPEPPDTGT